MRPLDFGLDIHAFGPGDHVMLGGVRIAHDRGLLAHSDGDVVLHALCDALLGAMGQGDIGQHFPDTDPRWKDADSMLLLKEVRRRVVAAGYEIVNVDTTVILERPKLASYIPDMRRNLADVLMIPSAAVSVKAKTNEKMDAVGRGKGIQVLAVVSIGGA
jgi:2-C-methyl-D-erythritol 2,4-cyclodiphosphate synthase